MKHTLAWWTARAKVSVDYRDVKMHTLTNEVQASRPRRASTDHHRRTTLTMAEFSLPQNSKVCRARSIRQARRRQERQVVQDLSLGSGHGENPRIDTYESISTAAGRWSWTR
jgi:hypothetical protein